MTRWLRRPIVWLPISGALLALVAWRSRVWDAGAILGTPDPLPLLCAVLLNGAITVLWAVRSADLLAAAGHPVAVGPLLPMTAFANTINNLTPGSAGEVVRAWMLRAHHGVPYATGAAVIVIERVVAIGYLGASAAIVWIGHLLALPGPAVLAGLALLVALPGLAYGAGLRPAAAVARLPLGRVVGEARWARLGGALGRMDATIAALLTHPRHLAVFAGTTALVFAAYAAQLWLVAASVGIAIDPVAGWGALGLAVVAGVLSLLPFGLGATDLVLAALLGALGVAAPAAAAVAFGNRLVSTLPLGLLGAVSYGWLSARLPVGGATAALSAARAEMAGDPAGDAP
ncbi:MAG: lysylphosphatidylglycerol synthase transmembrane domain-containing protein [Chloroflexota bacterium]